MNRINLTLIISALFFAVSCGNEQKPATEKTEEKVLSEAEALVNKSIEAHGMEGLVKSTVNFDFRGRNYIAERNEGFYVYSRIFEDSLGRRVEDVLSNKGFERTVGGEKVEVPEEKAAAYSNSINSVIYFALLPYFLNDAAAMKEKIGEGTIKGEAYHKIKVTFQQDGGGKDFDDQYVYWIHKEKNTVDYLAYNYQVNGGGARFREAYNIRSVNGVRFADYINYKPKSGSMEVQKFDSLFESGELEELSRIDSENVKVEFTNAT
ncbi:DUF6503 family protein [Flammeovirgaceae bacterium SG7u.111]|nr:DUF6503 family protein [Flammeovirgaceae bacterium SG7u.132]WPO38103.1 DUF6503 family protein [Flammeovirgaceae bacterium SG7u.111]